MSSPNRHDPAGMYDENAYDYSVPLVVSQIIKAEAEIKGVDPDDILEMLERKSSNEDPGYSDILCQSWDLLLYAQDMEN